MEQQKADAIRSQLEAEFEGHHVTSKSLPEGKVAFLIRGVPLPQGCAPDVTDVLLLFNPAGIPELYTQPGIKAVGGVNPRNTYNETVDGEPWMRFSTKLTYDPTKPLSFFVYSKLGRFMNAV